MDRSRNFRDLLFADVALAMGIVDAEAVAGALQGAQDVPDALGLDDWARCRIDDEVERIVTDADGDARVAVARRGGIDRSIHASLTPGTSRTLMQQGAGARAPLRAVPADRYHEFTLVGKGGMGVVYLALDTELNRRVAFKMVRPDPEAPRDAPAPDLPLEATPPSDDRAPSSSRSFEELKIRFLQEAWVTGAMEHPGVVPVYELGQTTAGIPYYTMRYVTGERTLADAIRDAKDTDDRLGLLEPFLKVCDALRYAHSRNVVHRDVKPENIALGQFGEAIVLDWGLSKMQGRPDVSQSLWRARIAEYRDAADLQSVAGALGTPGYMAPEAALGKTGEVDGQSDVYSLGAILFQILTGRLPFEFTTFIEYVHKVLKEVPPDAKELQPGLPDELAGVCAKALAREKEDRYGTVDELARAVRRWQTEGPIDRQVADLLGAARDELDAAKRTEGNVRLWHLDRASAACSKVLHLRQDHEQARELGAEIKELRERGIRARVHAARRKVIAVVALALLVIATLVVGNFARILSDERERAERRLEDARADVVRERALARRAARGRDAALARLANAYASLAREHLNDDRVAEARLAAAKALATRPTPAAWEAMAAADARWAPTLTTVVRGANAMCVAFRPDGARVFLGGEDHAIREYDPASMEIVRALEGHEAPVDALAVSHDGARLVSAAQTGRIKVWDLESGTVVADLPKELEKVRKSLESLLNSNVVVRGTGIRALAVSRDGRRVYAAYADGNVRDWEVETGEIMGARIQIGSPAPTTLRLGPKGRLLYGAAKDEVVVWSLDRFRETHTFATDGVVQVVGSADATSAHACTADRRVFLLEFETGRQFQVFDSRPGPPAVLLLAPDVKRLYAGEADGALRIWDLEGRGLAAQVRGPTGPVRSLGLGPDGRSLAVVDGEGTLRLYDLTMRWASNGAETATALTASPDGSRWYVGRPDRTIEVWDPASGRSLARLRGHRATIAALALGPDGARLFSGDVGGTIRAWNADTSVAGEVHVPDARVTALLASADPDEVWVGTLGGGVQRWNWRAERRVRRLHALEDGALGPVAAIALLDAPRRIVAKHAGGATSAWDVASGEPAEASFPETGTPPAGAHPVRILGSRSPWVLKDPASRLIDVENAFAVLLEGFEARPVPLDRYEPRHARIEPWSR